jgi:hypothetical protein
MSRLSWFLVDVVGREFVASVDPDNLLPTTRDLHAEERRADHRSRAGPCNTNRSSPGLLTTPNANQHRAMQLLQQITL